MKENMAARNYEVLRATAERKTSLKKVKESCDGIDGWAKLNE
jgi:hypothetical protein